MVYYYSYIFNLMGAVLGDVLPRPGAPLDPARGVGAREEHLGAAREAAAPDRRLRVRARHGGVAERGAERDVERAGPDGIRAAPGAADVVWKWGHVSGETTRVKTSREGALQVCRCANMRKAAYSCSNSGLLTLLAHSGPPWASNM